MAPKPKPQQELAGISETLDFIKSQLLQLDRLEKLDGMEIQMSDLLREFQNLKKENAKKDQQIKSLTIRLEELEQAERINDLIITGIKIKPPSYAKVLRTENDGDLTNVEESHSVETQVAEILHRLKIKFNTENVDYCYLLPKKNTEGAQVNRPRAVLLRFTGKKHKIALLQQGKNLKGSDVYFNENLSKGNASIAWKARQLKKENKILSTWTANCKVYIKPNGATPETRPVLIRAMEELDKYNN